jgi:hypothetical protein
MQEGEYIDAFEEIFDEIDNELYALDQVCNETLGFTFDYDLPKNGTLEERLSGTISLVNSIVDEVNQALAVATPSQAAAVNKTLIKVEVLLSVAQVFLSFSSFHSLFIYFPSLFVFLSFVISGFVEYYELRLFAKCGEAAAR